MKCKKCGNEIDKDLHSDILKDYCIDCILKDIEKFHEEIEKINSCEHK